MSEVKKKITIVVPCYNEEENVEPMYRAICSEFAQKPVLGRYDFEILYIDNASQDKTRQKLRELAEKDRVRVKAIFNVKNFGQFNSPYYAMLQAQGDIVMLMAADFQDPPELIEKFVEGYEEGYKIVIGVKAHSTDSKVLYAFKRTYYKLIHRYSNVEQIKNFTGFGLYDRKFIDVLRELNDPTPFLRGIVAELGYPHKEIPYDQPLRRAGITSNNFYSLYDAAMLGVTSYTKVGLRWATFFGIICAAIAVLVALVYLIMKLIWWDRFAAGTIPILLGMLFLGAIQLFFIGMMGEYILSINQRTMKRPLVVEEERLNFDAQTDGKEAPLLFGTDAKETSQPSAADAKKIARPSSPDTEETVQPSGGDTK